MQSGTDAGAHAPQGATAREGGAADVALIPTKSVIDFLTLVQNLKTTKRTGWVRNNISQPESIADHMYRMGIMALIAGDKDVDCNRCVKLALVHDLAEALVGDITPHCKISHEEKFARESAAIQQIKDMVGADTPQGQEIAALWHEYEDGRTREALLVKDLDKVEMLLQAQEYEAAQGAALQEFFDSTMGRFKTDIGKAWAQEIASRRGQLQPTPHAAEDNDSNAARPAKQ